MRIVIITPPFGEKGTKSNSVQVAPPILEYLASLTLHLRPDIDVALIDCNREDPDFDSIDADLVTFSSLTPRPCGFTGRQTSCAREESRLS